MKSDVQASSGARKAVSDIAYEQIRKAILTNTLPPGAKIVERDIASQLGISRTPVREALSRLTTDGLVEVTGGRGVQVSLIRSADLRQVYDVLSALESQAAVLLARRPPESRNTAVVAMREALDKMDEVLEFRKLDEWSDLDDQFHQELFKGCNNPRLARIATVEIDLGRRSRVWTLHLRSNLTQSNVEHAAILDAIINGESDKARKAVLAHRERTANVIIPLLEKLESKSRPLTAIRN